MTNEEKILKNINELKNDHNQVKHLLAQIEKIAKKNSISFSMGDKECAIDDYFSKRLSLARSQLAVLRGE